MVDSIEFEGWRFPAYERHLQEWMRQANDRRHGRLTYQATKYDLVIRHVKQRRAVVDVGGHIGLWSFLMACDFEHVVAFEPTPLHAALWRENMAGRENAILHECALGSHVASIAMKTHTADSSGDTRIAGEGDIPMQTLDSFALQDVDLIKVDTEGYEFNVLRGAQETLLRCKPTVIVEQKRDHSLYFGIPKLEAVHYLESLGATLRAEQSGDYILAWD